MVIDIDVPTVITIVGGVIAVMGLMARALGMMIINGIYTKIASCQESLRDEIDEVKGIALRADKEAVAAHSRIDNFLIELAKNGGVNGK